MRPFATCHRLYVVLSGRRTRPIAYALARKRPKISEVRWTHSGPREPWKLLRDRPDIRRSRARPGNHPTHFIFLVRPLLYYSYI